MDFTRPPTDLVQGPTNNGVGTAAIGSMTGVGAVTYNRRHRHQRRDGLGLWRSEMLGVSRINQAVIGTGRKASSIFGQVTS
jgi:hypothetical protein